MSEKRPLADEIRPLTLDEVVGQKHLLGKGALLRRLIESGSSANMIFYGPSGTGKTFRASTFWRLLLILFAPEIKASDSCFAVIKSYAPSGRRRGGRPLQK